MNGPGRTTEWRRSERGTAPKSNAAGRFTSGLRTSPSLGDKTGKLVEYSEGEQSDLLVLPSRKGVGGKEGFLQHGRKSVTLPKRCPGSLASAHRSHLLRLVGVLEACA